jgi:hypothetical protein
MGWDGRHIWVKTKVNECDEEKILGEGGLPVVELLPSLLETLGWIHSTQKTATTIVESTLEKYI